MSDNFGWNRRRFMPLTIYVQLLRNREELIAPI
jgi:hypothetical protein